MDENTYAVGWFTLLFINTNIAQLKGRSPFGWFLLSLFFGPIATFFLMFAQPPYVVGEVVRADARLQPRAATAGD